MMNIFKNTIYIIIFGLAMIIAGQVQAATEFVSVVDPDDAFGTDYTSLSAWEGATQADLSTTTATLVFSYGAGTASGTIPDGTTVVGQTSGAVASSTHMTGTTTSAQIMLTNITGVFQQNEAVYIQGQSASSTYVYLSDSGDSVIAVAKCRSTGGTMDGTAVEVNGWTTSVDNYVKLWTDPTDVYGRHNGVWSDSKYRIGNGLVHGDMVLINDDYITVDGLQFYSSTGGSDRCITSYNSDTTVLNNIARGTPGGSTGIYLAQNSATSNHKVYNNIVYNFNGSGIYSYGEAYVYNNTISSGGRSGNLYGIYSSSGRVRAYNNIVQDHTGSLEYGGTFHADSGYNISDDWSAPGSNSLTTTTVSFVNTAGYDFHLALDDTVARDAGTTTIYKYDVDGTARGGAFDIGADEVPVDYTSIICEGIGAGGNCDDLDYTTLWDWDDQVEVDLTASSTRVFSGFTTGTLTDGATVNLCDGVTDLNIDGVVDATTTDQILVRNIVGTSTPLIVASSTIWSDEACSGATNFWTVAGTGDELGASARAVAEIDGTWTNPDTTELSISDNSFPTDNDNYIKIYTTDLARHNGTWSTTKYRLESASGRAIINYSPYVRVYGLQLYSAVFAAYRGATGGEEHIANNIIKGNSVDYREAIFLYGEGGKIKIWNNIIYGKYGLDASGIQINDADAEVYIYNNTIFDCIRGIEVSAGTAIAKNNIVASTTNDFIGTFDSGTEYNATDSTDTPTGGSNTIINADINFVSTVSGSEDLHLKENNSDVIDGGVDLSNDVWIPASAGMTMDVDGSTRWASSSQEVAGWDIGADEVNERTATSTGRWSATSTWTGGYVPRSWETVTIPAGITVTYDNGNLFQDDFENNAFSDWGSSGSESGNSSAIDSTKYYSGDYSAKFVFGGTSGSDENYYTKDLGLDQNDLYYRANVFVESDSLSNTEEISVTEFSMTTIMSTKVGGISIYKNGQNLELKAYYHNGTALTAFSVNKAISTSTWYTVEWYQKASAGAGEAYFWVNGREIASSTGLTNDSNFTEALHVGQYLDTNDEAIIFYLDDVAVDSESRIGQRPTGTSTERAFAIDYNMRELTIADTATLSTGAVIDADYSYRFPLWVYGDVNVDGTLDQNVKSEIRIKNDTTVESGIIVSSTGKLDVLGTSKTYQDVVISSVIQDGSHNGYVLCQANSECNFEYADVSYLGDGVTNKYGVTTGGTVNTISNEGFYVKGSNFYNNYYGCYVGSYNILINDSKFYNNSVYGIRIHNVSGSLIVNNMIFSNGSSGFYTAENGRHRFVNNIAFDNTYGFNSGWDGDDNVFYNNISVGNTANYTTNGVADDNIFKNSLSAYSAEGFLDSGANNIIDNNLFYGNTTDSATGTNAIESDPLFYNFDNSPSGNDNGGSERSVSSATSDTLSASSPSWTVDEWKGFTVWTDDDFSSTGGSQFRYILSNTADTLTIAGTWDTIPDASYEFKIIDFSVGADSPALGAGATTTPDTSTGQINIGAITDYTYSTTDTKAYSSMQLAHDNDSTGAGDTLTTYTNNLLSSVISGSVTDIGNGFYSFAIDEDILTDDVYNGFYLYVSAGVNRGNYYTILDTVASTDTLYIFDSEQTVTLFDNDEFVIVDRVYDRVGQYINSTEKYNTYFTKDGISVNPITWNSSGRVIIDGGKNNLYSNFRLQSASYNVVDGFNLTGSLNYSVLLSSGDYAVLQNLTVNDNGDIPGNNSDDGIYMNNTDYSVVQNCEIFNNMGDGVDYDSVSDYNVILDSTVHGNGYRSLYLREGALIKNNNIFGNANAVAVSGNGISLIGNKYFRQSGAMGVYSDRARIYNNVAVETSGHGVWFQGSAVNDSVVQNNIFMGNFEGIDDADTTNSNSYDFNFYYDNTTDYNGTQSIGANSITGTDPNFKSSDTGTADSGSTASMIIDAGQSWTANEWVGYGFKISISGTDYWAGVTSNTEDRLYLAPDLGATPSVSDAFIITDFSIIGTSSDSVTSPLGQGASADGTTEPGTVNMGAMTDYSRNTTDSMHFNHMQDAHDDAGLNAGDTVTTYAVDELSSGNLIGTTSDLGPFIKMEVAEANIIEDNQYVGMYLYVTAGENRGLSYLITDSDEATVDTITILTDMATSTFWTDDEFLIVDRAYEKMGSTDNSAIVHITKDGNASSSITWDTDGSVILKGDSTTEQGISLDTADYHVLNDFIIENFKYNSIFLYNGSDYNTVSDNVLSHNGKIQQPYLLYNGGVSIWNSCIYNTVEDNEVFSGRYGVVLSDSNNSAILNNKIYDNFKAGIELRSDYGVVAGNVNYGSTDTWATGIYAEGDYNVVARNKSFLNYSHSIGVVGVSNVVKNNVCALSIARDGIETNTTNGLYRNNIFYSNNDFGVDNNGGATNDIAYNFYYDNNNGPIEGGTASSTSITGHDPNFKIIESGVVDAGTTDSYVYDASLSMTANEHIGKAVRVTVSGTDYWAGITSNTTDRLFITPALGATPTAGDAFIVTDFSLTSTTTTATATPIGTGASADGQTKTGGVNMGAETGFVINMTDLKIFNSHQFAHDDSSLTAGDTVTTYTNDEVSDETVGATVTDLGPFVQFEVDEDVIVNDDDYVGMYVYMVTGKKRGAYYLISDSDENTTDTITVVVDDVEEINENDVYHIIDRVYTREDYRSGDTSAVVRFAKDGDSINPIIWDTSGTVILDQLVDTVSDRTVVMDDSSYYVLDGFNLIGHGYGLSMLNNSRFNIVRNNNIYDNSSRGIGLYNNCSYNVFENNDIYENGSIGFYSGTNNIENSVINNRMYTNDSYSAIYIGSGSYNNLIKENTLFAGKNQFSRGVQVSVSSSTIDNNIVFRMNYYGISFEDVNAYDNLVKNNTVLESGISNIRFFTNVADNNAYNNVLLNSSNGIYSSSGASNTHDFNFFYNNSTADVSGGTDTPGANSITGTDPGFKTVDSGTVASGATTEMFVISGESWTANEYLGYGVTFTGGSCPVEDEWVGVISNSEDHAYVAPALSAVPDTNCTAVFTDFSITGTTTSSVISPLGQGATADNSTEPGTVNMGAITDYSRNVTDSMHFTGLQDAHDDAGLSAGDTVTTYAVNEVTSGTFGTSTDLGNMVEVEVNESAITADNQYEGMYLYIEAGINKGKHYLIVDSDEAGTDTVTLHVDSNDGFNEGDVFTIVDRVYDRKGYSYGATTENMYVTKDGTADSPITWNVSGNVIASGKNEQTYVFFLHNNYYNIFDGFIISDASETGLEDLVSAGGGNTFRNLIVCNNVYSGIEYSRGYDNIAENNEVFRNGSYGIGVSGVVRNNLSFSNGKTYLYRYALGSSDGQLVSSNVSFDNHNTGIEAFSNATIRENIVIKNVSQGVDTSYHADDTKVFNNTFVEVSNGAGSGINIENNDDNLDIRNNIFMSLVYGIYDGSGTADYDYNFYYNNTVDINSSNPIGTSSITGYNPYFKELVSSTADANSTTTVIIDVSKTWTTNQWVGYGFKITISGTDYWAGITSNSASRLFLAPALDVMPNTDDAYIITDFSITATSTSASTTPLGWGVGANGTSSPGTINMGAHLGYTYNANINSGTRYNSIQDAHDDVSLASGDNVLVYAVDELSSGAISNTTDLGPMIALDVDEASVTSDNDFSGMYLYMLTGTNAYDHYLIARTDENTQDTVTIVSDIASSTFSNGDTFRIVDRVYNEISNPVTPTSPNANLEITKSGDGLADRIEFSSNGTVIIDAYNAIASTFQYPTTNFDYNISDASGIVFVTMNNFQLANADEWAVEGNTNYEIQGVGAESDYCWPNCSDTATEFVATIDPDNGAGTDFTSLAAWEAAVQVDLTSPNTMVFSVTSATGSFPVDVTVVGQTSGATASSTLLATSSSQMLLHNISPYEGNTFQSGELVYIQGAATTTANVTLTDGGNMVIAVAKCRSTGGSADEIAVTVNGWTTSAANYIKIWTDPTDVYGRHNGVWSDEKYRLVNDNNTYTSTIDTGENNIVIDGLQVFLSYIHMRAIYIDGSNGTYTTVKNCIVKSDNNTNEVGIYTNYYNQTIYLYNNIVYNFAGSGIYKGDGNTYAYNNTIYNCNGVYSNTNRISIFVNNIVQNTVNGFTGTYDSGTTNNISDDGTAPGTNSLSSTTVSFVNTTGNDFHLALDDTVARDAGTTTIYKYDIDGTARGGAFDIGADEVPVDYTSIICEDVSAGGGCADLDYTILSDWEDAVESDLTASTTRVFSGYMFGSMDANDGVVLYNGGLLGISGTLIATTSDQVLIRDIAGTSTPLAVASGTRWQIDMSNYFVIQGTGDGLGASPRVVGEIDGSWNASDTVAVDIDGWETDNDNYIKIYTTDTARHRGVWDENKYILSVSGNQALTFSEAYIDVEGLQFRTYVSGDGVRLTNNTTGVLSISQNIIFNTGAHGINVDGLDTGGKANVYNNIIIEPGDVGIYHNWGAVSTINVFNNTIVNPVNYGIQLRAAAATTMNMVNNIVQNAGIDDYYLQNIDANDKNIASDDTSLNDAYDNVDVTFVSSSTDDYHVALNDKNAINAGADLSSTSTLSFLTDIDGGMRDVDGLGWDIGADETATKIYRSVGNDSSDLSNSATVTISGTTATFSVAQPNNVGVGDVIQFGGSGFYDLVFITERASSTEYSVQAWDGSSPIATTTAAMNIYRAHLELDDWEDQIPGDVNTAIDSSVENNVLVGQDLVASNTVMMVACYGSTDGDDAAVTISGWTAGASNYIKVYTPVSLSEVGVSQRHSGKWDSLKYYLHLETSASWETALYVYNDVQYARVDGLQVSVDYGHDVTVGISFANQLLANNEMRVSNNIVKGNCSASGITGMGIRGANGSSDNKFVVWNNVVYGFKDLNNTTGSCISVGGASDSDNQVFYNNTVYGCNRGFYDGMFHGGVLINNISYNNNDNYYGTFDVDCDYNISGPTQSGAPGSNSINAVTIQFVDEANDDFHLSPKDVVAVDMGTSSPGDSGLPSAPGMTRDIDGNYRRTWDIGADEASINFDSAVMESGGEFTSLSAWESANQVDLVATTTAVFSVSSNAGWIPVGSSLTGSSSGATASTTVVATSSNKILLYNITGTFVSGETVSMDSAVGNYVVLSNEGNPAIAVARVDGAWTVSDTVELTIDGWTTGVNNYIKIYTTDSARHQGKWSENKYRLDYGHDSVTVMEDFVWIDGLQMRFKWDYSSTKSGVIFDHQGNDNIEFKFSNCLVTEYPNQNYLTTSVARFPFVSGTHPCDVFMWNNIFYDFGEASAVTFSESSFTGYIYSNTFINNQYGVGQVNGTIIVKNNIAQNSVTNDYEGSFSALSGNNVSSDWTAPGTNSMTTTTVQFTDATNKDFHLSPNDTSVRNNGTTTTGDINYYYDIDGTARGASWDIGADELPTTYTSIICENTSAGGNCSDMDYSTLSDWEDAVESNLASSSTRVFGGSGTGSLNENDAVYLTDASGTTTATGFVVATTSDQILIDGIVGSTTLPVIASTSYVWRKDASNYWSVSGSDDDFGASVQVTAEIDGAWVSAATNTVVIDDFITDNDNFVKIYTTGLARHDGVWKNTAYRIETVATRALFSYIEYFWADGLQFYAGDWSAFRSSTDFGEVNFSNNIVKGNAVGSRQGVYIIYNKGVVNIWNNVIYNNLGPSAIGMKINDSDTTANIYNNTLYNNTIGIDADGVTIAKNNLVASTTNPFSGTFATGTDYNATDNSDTPGIGDNNIVNANFTFISTTTGSEDFHLDPDDTGAKDQGTNLRSDEYINVIDDIDGSARANGFDIGADETAVKIFRSVGPSNTTALSTGSSTTLTIDNLNATFSVAQADNIGVGDAIQYDSDGNGSIDSIAFIFSRTDSTHYVVTTASGTIPTAVAGDNDWQIYRAYTSLSNAATGTESTAINASLRDFDFWSGGYDLVANNVVWNIACYGDAVDTNDVAINGWTAGENNYLKIFTPVSTSEVGVTQRHSGKWDDDKYRIETTDAGVDIEDGFVRVEGLQIKPEMSYVSARTAIVVRPNQSSTKVYVSDNILTVGTNSVTGNGVSARYNSGVTNIEIYIWNNIIYGFDGADGTGIYAGENDNSIYVYSNTVYDCDRGYRNSATTFELINNIAQNCTYGFSGTFDASSNYNISDISGDNTGGANDKDDTTVKFVDATNKDFHLHPSDTSAIDAGTSSVSSLFADDIDGNTRRTWDIGADDASINFDSTIMESGGEFSSLSAWEAANQVDLTANDTAVFAIASSTGWIPVGSDVTGVTSGATASTTVVATSSNKILLYNISGIFVSGEDVQLDGATSNAVELANDGNPAIAVAKIDGAWASADTSYANITGWTTSKYNYIKIYTTESARHQGKWDDSKYHISINVWNPGFRSAEDYVRVDGLQIERIYSDGVDATVSIDQAKEIYFSNNIINRTNTSGSGIRFDGISDGVYHAWNNIVYGSHDYGIYENWLSVNATLYIFNNTVSNCSQWGIRRAEATVIVKNNIVQNSTINYYGTFSALSLNNISSDSTAPGTNSKINTTVSFVDATHYDFHLALTDTAARNAGVDLSSDATSSFAMDIDGTSRGGAWDIGADEASTEFVSSVMETGGDYSSLSAWEDAVEVNLVASGTLTYHGTLTGTLLQDDTLTLIRSGATSTVTGTVVATTSSQILVKNIVDSRGESYSLTTATGDIWRKDISNYWTVTGTGDQLGAPVIAVAKIDGTWSATDTTAVVIDGWTTGPGNYVRVYTTDLARHDGKWSYGKYRIFPSADEHSINIRENNVRIDGLQIKTYSGRRAIYYYWNGLTYINAYVSNNLINGNEFSGLHGIWIDSIGGYSSYGNVWNNIIYDFSGISIAIGGGGSSLFRVYNNTIYNSITGISTGNQDTIAKNNIVASSTDGFSGTFAAGSDYNISNVVSDAPGNNSQNNATVTFVSTSTNDFHLSPTDTTANNKGVNLTYDPYLAFTTDIDGDTRSTVWDIGADQNNSVNSSGESANPQLGVPPVDLTEGLVGHWDFNAGFGSTVVDKSGNGNDGTWSGSGDHWTGVGRYGNGGKFNDIDNKVTIAQNSSINDIEKLTISAWLYHEGGTVYYDGIVNKDSGGWSVYRNGDYFHFAAQRWSDTMGNWRVERQNILNKWIHLIVTYDYSSLDNDPVFYIDGKKYISFEEQTPDGSLTSETDDICIGNRCTAGRPFKGIIDEVRLYNRNLTQTEIATLYNKGLANNEWHFRNDYKDRGSVCEQGSCKDLSSGGTGNQFTTGYLERSTTALSLNGSGYATLADDSYFDIASTADFSIVATVKTSDTGNTIISKRSNSDAGSAGYLFGLINNGDARPYFEMSDGANEFYMQASESISDNEWHTIVVVIDKDSQAGNKIYIDGVDKTSTKIGTITSVYDTANSVALNIGRNGDDTGYFTGSIDRIALLHYALTRDEILRESAGGSNIDVGTPERTVAGGTSWDPHGGDAPVAWWMFDEMSGGTVKDYASSSLDGTWNGTGSHWRKGKQGMGGNFNGVDDWVAHSSFTFNDATPHTYSAWLKWSGATMPQYVMPFGQQELAINTIYLRASGMSRFSFRTSAGARLVTGSDTSALFDKNWHYISWTVTSGRLVSVYIDGALNSSAVLSETDMEYSSIGYGYYGYDNLWNGQIDDVKIYDYARTSAQIVWDYNKGAPIAHWKFDEASSGSADGVSILDSSGNGLTGVGTGGVGIDWIDGKFGNAIDFDASNDAVYVVDNDLLDISDQITVSVWTKPQSYDYEGTGRAYNHIVSKWNSYTLRVFDDATAGVYGFGFTIDDGGEHTAASDNPSDVVATSSAWYHVTGTYDGSTVKLYVNGILEEINSYSGDIDVDTNDLYIGNYESMTSGAEFDGLVDDVRIYNYALTDDQVKGVYNGASVYFGDN